MEEGNLPKIQKSGPDFLVWRRELYKKEKEMEEEKEKNERIEIWKEPKLTEKELVTIVDTNRQKNWKGARVDGVRAKLLKSLIKKNQGASAKKL